MFDLECDLPNLLLFDERLPLNAIRQGKVEASKQQSKGSANFQ